MVGVKLRIERRPAPEITAISPSVVSATSDDLTLTIDGLAFSSDSVARIDGYDLATTYVSSTQLTAVVTSSRIRTPGDHTVVVFTPAPGGGTSSPAKLTSEAGSDGPGWAYDPNVPWGVTGANDELATFLVAPNDFQRGWGHWYMVVGAHPVAGNTGVHYYELETDIFAPNDTTFGPWVMVGAESTVAGNPHGGENYFDLYGYGGYWTADGWSSSRDAYGTWLLGYGAAPSTATLFSDTILTAPGVAGVRLDTNTDTMSFYLNDAPIWTVSYPAITYPVVAALTIYGTIGSAKDHLGARGAALPGARRRPRLVAFGHIQPERHS